MSFQMSTIPMPRSKDYEAFLLEEKRRADEAVQRVVERQNAELKQGYQSLLKALGKTWSKPLAKIREAWQSGKRAPMLPYYFDLVLRPTNADGSPIPKGEQTGDDATREFSKFVESTLPTKFGFRLSISGLQRFQLFVYIHTFCGKHLVSEDNLTRYFNALVDSEAFDAADLTYDESLIVKAPAPERDVTVNDLDGVDTSTPEGFRKAKDIADNLMFAEAQPIFRLWRTSLSENFNVTISDDDIRYMCEWFLANNKNWLDKRSYDAFRLHMVRTGRWSEHLLTIEDIRERAVDRLNMDDRDIRAIVLHGTKNALLDLMKHKGVSLI